MRLILASQSPRRCEILKNAGFVFDVCPSDVEEIIDKSLCEQELVMSLAKQKATEVFEKLGGKEGIAVLGSDTIVVKDKKILGKPKSELEALSMLSMLSGEKHYVYTGVCVVAKGRQQSFFDCTEVEFLPLTQECIRQYISTGEPMDKAGAYGIQGKGSMLIKGINGDFFAVMGLPIAKTAKALELFGVYPQI